MIPSLNNFLFRLYYARTLRKLKKYGRNLKLSSGGLILFPEELSIGSNVFINRQFRIVAWSMSIGDNVMIGPNFTAECRDHRFDICGKTMFETSDQYRLAPIIIQDDVWIGAQVTVLKGVTIGEGCVVGAGSVVTRNLPPYTICVGNPCRPIKCRFPAEILEKHLNMVNSSFSASELTELWKSYASLTEKRQ